MAIIIYTRNELNRKEKQNEVIIVSFQRTKI